MKYYHGSLNKIKNGEELISKESEGYTSCLEALEVEDLFEKHRPENKISRKTAVYLAENIKDIDNLGGYDDYVYEVEPKSGIAEKSDLSWYSDVSLFVGEVNIKESDITPEVFLMIKNYWNGTPSDNPVFEYRCTSSKIICDIDEKNKNMKIKL